MATAITAPAPSLPRSLSEAEAQAVRKFQNWLADTMPGQVERLILFGSKARGDTHGESDVDLLLELRESSPARRAAISNFVVDTELQTGIDMMVLVYSRESLEDEVSLGTALMRNVAADGFAILGERIMVGQGLPSEVAHELIESARNHLAAARALRDQGLNRGAVAEAYYAFLDAADAALAMKAVTPRSHSGTIDLFGLHFIKNGPVHAKYSKWFKQAREWRLEGTYKRRLEWSEEEVQTAIESAQEFVDVIDALIPELLADQPADDETGPDGTSTTDAAN